MITKIFILLCNKYENDEFVSLTKRYLKKLGESHIIEIDDAENEEVAAVSSETNNLFAVPTKFRSWIQNISDDIQENYVNNCMNCSSLDDSFLIDNIYYGPHLQKPFIDFLVEIPLFSNIMQKSFKSTNDVATSSPTETGFNFLKNQLLQHKTRMRADVFVEKHIDYLLGHMKTLGTQKYLKLADEGIDKIAEENDNISEKNCSCHEIDDNCDPEMENYYEEN